MVVIYGILSAIDYMIYSLAAVMFRLIMDIANIEFFSQNDITSIANRVYIVVGVLMLFKLVISAIQYMVNPDSFDDKEKGMGGILMRMVVSLALIVVVPAIFRFAISMQKPIVESIPNIIFGSEERTDFKDDKAGKNITFQVLSAFIPVREGHENKIAATEKISDLESFRKNIMAGCPGVSLFGIFGSYDTCHYNYMILISTAAGVFMCYVLFVMTLDIAIRTIKFGVVQILAPIPISGYVLDKSKLSKFAKTAVTVYLDLFIRMAVIYFIVFAIQKVLDSGLIKQLADGDVFREVLANIVIIIGLLMFAKNAPKFITDLLGLQDVSSDDMKNMFARAGGMFGATVGAGKSLISSRANARNEAVNEYKKKYGVSDDDWNGLRRKSKNKAIKDAVKEYNKKQGFGHGVAGRALRSSGAAFGKGTYQSYIKGKGFKETFDASDRAGQKSYDLDKALRDNNTSRAAYHREILNRRLGINADLDTMNTEIEASKNASDKSKAALDFITGNAKKFVTTRYDSTALNKLQNDVAKKFGRMYDATTHKITLGTDKKGNTVEIDLSNDNIMSTISRVNAILTDASGLYDDKNGQIKNFASGLQDKLEGFAQTYVINKTKALETATKNNDIRTMNLIKSLGFDEKPNPRLMTIIQEAAEANAIHSGDTQYGREVWEKACAEDIMLPKMENGRIVTDSNGNVVYTHDVKPERFGDWLALNKSEGQKVQTSNIAAKGTQAASAIAKSLADKFDKK